MNKVNKLDKVVTAIENTQIAFPVGKNRESYIIQTFFHLNPITNEVTHTHQVIKNWSSTTRRENLIKGTYLECYNYINEIVAEIALQAEADEQAEYNRLLDETK